MDFTFWGLPGLLFGCFLSATVLPFPSEALVLYFLSKHENVWIVVLLSTIGNAFGGITTYYLGRAGNQWKKVRETGKAYRLVQKLGPFSALFSWLPIIGDAILLLLGYYKAPAPWTLSLMTFGKFLRYLILAWAFIQVS